MAGETGRGRMAWLGSGEACKSSVHVLVHAHVVLAPYAFAQFLLPALISSLKGIHLIVHKSPTSVHAFAAAFRLMARAMI